MENTQAEGSRRQISPHQTQRKPSRKWAITQLWPPHSSPQGGYSKPSLGWIHHPGPPLQLLGDHGLGGPGPPMGPGHVGEVMGHRANLWSHDTPGSPEHLGPGAHFCPGGLQ
ncbi:hypothetical protein O181_128994 [Austropuccinia psidii MF-1]|uniref:Uncharacterized protein n=1 Tax=Austropuccinia psidii MF-1 TaxID=1389203 RepID=A0A9Q3Q8N9_9BASI|nr:hypothetical protein [Austropuccinia psidii MF-1]